MALTRIAAVSAPKRTPGVGEISPQVRDILVLEVTAVGAIGPCPCLQDECFSVPEMQGFFVWLRLPYAAPKEEGPAF